MVSDASSYTSVSPLSGAGALSALQRGFNFVFSGGYAAFFALTSPLIKGFDALVSGKSGRLSWGYIWAGVGYYAQSAIGSTAVERERVVTGYANFLNEQIGGLISVDTTVDSRGHKSLIYLTSELVQKDYRDVGYTRADRFSGNVLADHTAYYLNFRCPQMNDATCRNFDGYELSAQQEAINGQYQIVAQLLTTTGRVPERIAGDYGNIIAEAESPDVRSLKRAVEAKIKGLDVPKLRLEITKLSDLVSGKVLSQGVVDYRSNNSAAMIDNAADDHSKKHGHENRPETALVRS